ncbi:uncharacterized protein LOC112904678 [Agrilus planipennis]|uniref:Uncharacterized protein LOC112904678 n=1 Tax=Agrilus planipennis TaxID=224129 RepID=A0A7F5R0G3_AGRPL|nr:uncharacterized protein LOC112904678 [Agrilus planipennis]
MKKTKYFSFGLAYVNKTSFFCTHYEVYFKPLLHAARPGTYKRVLARPSVYFHGIGRRGDCQLTLLVTWLPDRQRSESDTTSWRIALSSMVDLITTEDFRSLRLVIYLLQWRSSEIN